MLNFNEEVYILQEWISWFLLISLMILLMGAFINVYSGFFSNVILAVEDDIHLSKNVVEKQHVQDNRKKMSGDMSSISKTRKSNIQKHTSRKNGVSYKSRNDSSTTYKHKYTSYKEYKKYNSVSR